MPTSKINPEDKLLKTDSANKIFYFHIVFSMLVTTNIRLRNGNKHQYTSRFQNIIKKAIFKSSKGIILHVLVVINGLVREKNLSLLTNTTVVHKKY